MTRCRSVSEPAPANEKGCPVQTTEHARPTRSFIDRLGIYPPLVLGLCRPAAVHDRRRRRGRVSVARTWSTRGHRRCRTKCRTDLHRLRRRPWRSRPGSRGRCPICWGPRQVMALGLAIWVVFEVGLSAAGRGAGTTTWLITGAVRTLRGFGYPLFAYRLPGLDHGRHAAAAAGHRGRLVLVRIDRRAARPRARCSPALPIPRIGPYQTLWFSLGLGGPRRPDRAARRARADREAPARAAGRAPVRTLLSSVSIAWEEPKTAIGCIVRVINTAPQYGFLVFLPIYFTETIGFTHGRVAAPAEPHVPEQHHLEPAVRDHRRQARLAADGGLLRRRRLGRSPRCCSTTCRTRLGPNYPLAVAGRRCCTARRWPGMCRSRP